jgi:hypothetical protein
VIRFILFPLFVLLSLIGAQFLDCIITFTLKHTIKELSFYHIEELLTECNVHTVSIKFILHTQYSLPHLLLIFLCDSEPKSQVVAAQNDHYYQHTAEDKHPSHSPATESQTQVVAAAKDHHASERDTIQRKIDIKINQSQVGSTTIIRKNNIQSRK